MKYSMFTVLYNFDLDKADSYTNETARIGTEEHFNSKSLVMWWCQVFILTILFSDLKNLIHFV